jgi:hypothetical protein
MEQVLICSVLLKPVNFLPFCAANQEYRRRVAAASSVVAVVNFRRSLQVWMGKAAKYDDVTGHPRQTAT